MKIGPVFREQMQRMRREWRQGEHIVVSAPTGSGKTLLSRHLQDIRVDNGGHVIVFIMKPKGDSTIVNDYGDYTRWKSFKKKAPSWHNRVLLWPDISGLKGRRAIIAHQKEIFQEAFDEINHEGKRTVVIDEGLYCVDSDFMNMGPDLAMCHAIGRGDDLTMIDHMQRPSNMPLIVYGSAAHGFVGRTRELSDQKRLAEMGSRESSRELSDMIKRNERHDFTWIPIAPDWPAESLNLTR